MNLGVASAIVVSAFAVGCRASFPPYVTIDGLDIAYIPKAPDILPPPIRELNERIEQDKARRLSASVSECAKRLNDLRKSAIYVQNASDGVTIAGGMIGIGSGLAAAVISAANPKRSDGTTDPTGTITAAIFSAAGGLIALIGKLVDAPSIPLDKRSRAERQWEAAKLLIQQDTSLIVMPENEADYRVAMARLGECLNDSPSQDVPTTEEIEKRLQLSQPQATTSADGGSDQTTNPSPTPPPIQLIPVPHSPPPAPKK